MKLVFFTVFLVGVVCGIVAEKQKHVLSSMGNLAYISYIKRKLVQFGSWVKGLFNRKK